MLASGILLAGAPAAAHRPHSTPPPASTRRGAQLAARASPDTKEAQPAASAAAAPRVQRAGLGELGPIGITVGSTSADPKKKAKEGGAQAMQRAADAAGVSLGPIGLTIGSDLRPDSSSSDEDDGTGAPPLKSIASMTTAEWRATNEKDGCVDLWMKDEFNAASRLVGGRNAHYGIAPGIGSGEGPSVSDAPRHRVKIKNHFAAQEIEVEVPEDRFIMFEAEDQGLMLPYACRLGCCTACAVKVVSGEVYQPYSLGVSKELREQGYALMCVGFPLSDLELETVPEDEIYDLQFGRFFEEQALDPNGRNIEVANAFEAGEYDD